VLNENIAGSSAAADEPFCLFCIPCQINCDRVKPVLPGLVIFSRRWLQIAPASGA
jgi:hypothetical protein